MDSIRKRNRAVLLAGLQQLEPRFLLSGYTYNQLAAFPAAGIIYPNAFVVDGSGNVYGLGVQENGGEGLVFEIPAGSTTPTILGNFDGPNGNTPNTIVLDSATGALYGTAERGGANGVGDVWTLPHGSSTISVVASFSASNEGTVGFLGQHTSLVIDGSGDLFGTIPGGGSNDDGLVYEVPSGGNTIDPLVNFNVNNNGVASSGALTAPM
ncbi:MAG TPA: choice-of-anchor tandem repeat GloVer-containing protein, partial [Tepidisphaeraceae bacterium]|nr:choice-of-anchor tandem repeat GloVer-containing protein [Tepidisphaeraceae bacterium]